MDKDSWLKIWEDQAEFNRNFRPPPAAFSERSDQTKELVLALISEADELLRTVAWKKHRQAQMLENISHSEEELIDIFKCWISLCQINGIPPEKISKLYWLKSAVCRQRFSEEFLQKLKGPYVLLDLDNVLCNYTQGLVNVFGLFKPLMSVPLTVDPPLAPGEYPTAARLGITPEQWQGLKHQIRAGEFKANPAIFPVMPGAVEFVHWLQQWGIKVVIMTSRPIAQYQTLYTTTLKWLTLVEIEPDFIWWSGDKAEEAVLKGVREEILFAVDDDARFVRQFSDMNIPVYWFNRATTMTQELNTVFSFDMLQRRVQKLVEVER